MVDKNNVSNIFPLTPLQESMLYRQLASGTDAYIMQLRLWVNGKLDTVDFEKAWCIIVERHEALRTLFVSEGADRPLQVALRHINITIPLCDVSKLSKSNRLLAVDDFCREEKTSGFDLKRPPLFRLKLFRFSATRHLLVITFHHIIMDGWCQGILHDELLESYRAVREKRSPTLSSVPPFSRYVRYLSGLDIKAGLSYWKTTLDEYEKGGETSWMRRSPAPDGFYDLRREHFTLTDGSVSQLRDIAAGLGTTLNAAFQTLWGIVICRLSGKRDVVWGTVVSGRPPELPGSDRTIGLFINTIPVRFRIDSVVSFKETLATTGEFLSKSLRHQHMPLADVQRISGDRGDLFDHLVIFENYPSTPAESETTDDISIVPQSPLSGHTDYDLVCVVDAGEELDCCLKYNSTVIEEENARLMHDAFLTLADAVIENPDAPLADIKLLPKRVIHEMIHSLPIGEKLASNEKTFTDMFTEQAANTPDRPAIEACNGNLTYRELANASNAIAHELIEKAGILPGDRVALMTGRDRNMIPSILGIMKASAVFVPLDPGYPEERVRFILEDCQCRVVVASGESLTLLRKYDFLTLIDAEESITMQTPVMTPERRPELDDIVYIIYTSGSTGQPKGVVIEHRQLANFILGYTHSILDIHGAPLRIAFIANYVFDASGRAFYPSLCRGDTVCVVDEDTRLDGFALIRFLETERIDLLDGTPSLCSLMLEGGKGNDSLQRIVLGGEELKRTLVDRIRRIFPHAAITNVYGPTETTIDSTFFHVDGSGYDDWDIAPIGKPLPNQQVYVLDESLHILPVGAVGEICISGDGVARGYLDREKLTRESFVPDPFNPDGTLYRTGDLGRWQKDGNLIFLGRRDSQIKVRGFRIETGEIEVAILSEPQVNQCAVIANTDPEGNNTLCAYYEGKLTPHDLRSKIRGILPSYMIPDIFVPLDQMPITATGKIDRLALSRLVKSDPDTVQRQSYPSSVSGRLVIEAMEKVLSLKDISPSDNFFEIGGHSLMAARLTALLASKTGKRLPISAIYRFPSAGELADFTDRYDPALSDLIDDFRFHFGKGDKLLFCFPPYGATGIVYQQLSQALENCRLECFNFLQGIDFVREAAQVLLQHTSKSPVTLLGYSGGGNLAFEVACEVENNGGHIGRLIMIDSYRRMETVEVKRIRHEREMRRILESNEYSLFFPNVPSRNKAIKNGVAYAEYLCSGIEKGSINAHIDLLCADDDLPDPLQDRFGALRSRRKWNELTCASFQIIQGSGTHDEMLNAQNSILNAAIVHQILTDTQI